LIQLKPYKRAQEHYKVRIEQKLTEARDYPKIWFKLTKHIAGLGGYSETLTLIKDNIVYETVTEKAELLNSNFAEKATLDDGDKLPPDMQQNCPKQLNKVKFRPKVISRKLKNLILTKPPFLMIFLP
jgi:hypothetical protein